MPEIDINRNSHLIDPHLDIWGWEIPAYLYLGGLVAGLMIFGALATRGKSTEELSRWLRWVPFAPAVLISLGMFFLFIDLEHKLYVYRFYLAFRPASPMSWGAWVLLLIYPATLLWGLAGLTKQEVSTIAEFGLVKRFRLVGLIRWVRGLVDTRIEQLRLANIVLGVVLGLYTGILLGTFEARPLWNTTLLAPLFLASGLSTGAAFMMLFPLKKAERHTLVRWDLLAIGGEVVFLALFFIDRATSCVEGREQVARFFGGDLTAPFWTLVVVMGLAVPVILEVVESRRHLRATIVAPILILTGGLVLRWILVYAGQVPSIS